MTCLRRWRRRLTKSVLMWFAALLLTASASGPYTALLPWARAQGTPANPSAGNSKNPIDQPLAWFYEARKFHQSLGDYTCYLMTRERVRGVLQKENVMQFKFRPQPFSVYMKWLSPSDLASQEVGYIHGKNGNMMRVHPKKGGKLINWVNVAPNDPKVFEHSRHTIYEAGLSNAIEQLIRNFEQEKLLNKTEVAIAEYTYNNRRCNRIEFTRSERNNQTYCYRTVVYVDQETKLPIRMENYDWPVQGGAVGGELMEMFSYIDLRFNNRLTDGDFFPR